MIEDDIEPDCSFADELTAAVDEIGSGLPEWMDPAAEDFGFGPRVTQCLLELEWSSALGAGRSPYEFALKIAALEDGSDGSPPVPLDGASIAAFIHALGGSARMAIQRGISVHATAEPWTAFLSARGNHWRAILGKLSK